MLYEITKLLTGNGWKHAWLETNKQGIITQITTEKPSEKPNSIINGNFLPGFINAHSHAFQYAMAGMAETVTGRSDTFWTWRNRMYELALSISPEQLEVIAEMLYSEMLRNGTVHVVEFHYLHNASGSKRYNQPAELGIRLLNAAQKTGIGITLLPVMYNRGGFNRIAEPHQSRFLSKDTQQYFDLLEDTKKAVSLYQNATYGSGVHSLRAVTPEQLKEVHQNKGNKPFHLHIAEQIGEVNDCLTQTGVSPAQLLLDTIDLDGSECLVHGTHISSEEYQILTQKQTTVILCPSTEGNLGDGVFPMRDYLDMNGRWTVGSDSHVTLSHTEDLRWMDYVQRLNAKRRDTVRKGHFTSGEELYRQCLSGGATAAGIQYGPFFEVGMPMSGILLDRQHPLIAATESEFLLNTILYAGDTSMFERVFTFGKCVFNKNTYLEELNPLREQFTRTISQLGARK